MLIALVVAAGVATACSGDDAPVRSPLADPSTPPASTATIPPVTTAEPTPASPAPVPPGSALDLEQASAIAIERMAEWLGVAATDLVVQSATAMTWPNACMGIEVPDRACAQVVVDGYRVVLADAFDGVHTVHLDGDGTADWAGENAAAGTVIDVDSGAESLTVRTDDGELTLRRAPGTRFERSPITPGSRALVWFDAAPDGDSTPVLVRVVATAVSP